MVGFGSGIKHPGSATLVPGMLTSKFWRVFHIPPHWSGLTADAATAFTSRGQLHHSRLKMASGSYSIKNRNHCRHLYAWPFFSSPLESSCIILDVNDSCIILDYYRQSPPSHPTCLPSTAAFLNPASLYRYWYSVKVRMPSYVQILVRLSLNMQILVRLSYVKVFCFSSRHLMC
jgi:hypothetical protein